MKALVIAGLALQLCNAFIVIPTSRCRHACAMPPLSFQSTDEAVYRKGGNAGYTQPTVEPARVDCQEGNYYIDHATGDELCWGVAPTHARNFVKASSPDVSSQARSHLQMFLFPDEADGVYRKGGHMSNEQHHASEPPRALEENDCEEPYVDFATGDELCWAI